MGSYRHSNRFFPAFRLLATRTGAECKFYHVESKAAESAFSAKDHMIIDLSPLARRWHEHTSDEMLDRR